MPTYEVHHAESAGSMVIDVDVIKAASIQAAARTFKENCPDRLALRIYEVEDAPIGGGPKEPNGPVYEEDQDEC